MSTYSDVRTVFRKTHSCKRGQNLQKLEQWIYPQKSFFRLSYCILSFPSGCQLFSITIETYTTYNDDITYLNLFLVMLVNEIVTNEIFKTLI